MFNPFSFLWHFIHMPLYAIFMACDVASKPLLSILNIDHPCGMPINQSCVCIASMTSGFLLVQNSNSSQFYISFAAVPQCDGKHVVVGTVTDGLDVLRRIGAPLGWLQFAG